MEFTSTTSGAPFTDEELEFLMKSSSDYYREVLGHGRSMVVPVSKPTTKQGRPVRMLSAHVW